MSQEKVSIRDMAKEALKVALAGKRFVAGSVDFDGPKTVWGRISSRIDDYGPGVDAEFNINLFSLTEATDYIVAATVYADPKQEPVTTRGVENAVRPWLLCQLGEATVQNRINKLEESHGRQ